METCGSWYFTMSFQYFIKNDDEDVTFKFVFTLENDITCTIEMMTYNPVISHTLDDWTRFIKQMESNSEGIIVFDEKNGEASIDTCDGKTSFFVSRGGANGCGDIKIAMPNSACILMFKEMVAQISKS